MEARDLHQALRERCAETERRLKRVETTGGLTGGSLESGEYLKNVVYQVEAAPPPLPDT